MTPTGDLDARAERLNQLRAWGTSDGSIELMQRLQSAIEHECGTDYGLFPEEGDEGVLIEGDRPDGRPFHILVWMGAAANPPVEGKDGEP